VASTAVAAPLRATVQPRSTLSGTNAGSIFMFGDPAPARELFYTVGSCGLSTYFVGVVPDSMPLVAMPGNIMSQYGASQHNTLCGQIITMTNPAGVTRQAAIADTNVSDTNSIDMTSDLWTAFGQPANDGSIIPSLNWVINASSGGSSSGACLKQYTVVSGDFCYAIWTANGITEAQLRAWNPSLDAACDLAIGQVLCISK
jgi:hypothetical protein